MKRLIILTLGFWITATTLSAQDNHAHEEADDPHRHHIGLAGGGVYILKEREFAPAVNLHYNYLFHVKNIQLGTGLGFEAIVDQHRHYAVNVNLTYLPTHRLSVTAAPGVVFTDNKMAFSVHVETDYAFELGLFHLGPTFEVAWAKEDIHLMLGLHLGFDL